MSEEQLQREAPVVEAIMAPFHELYRLQKISASEFTAIYVIQVLVARAPGNWLGAKRPSLDLPHRMNFPLGELHLEPNIRKRVGAMTVGEVLNNFALKSTPQAVNRALLCWSNGDYPLELMFRIPHPLEVLEQQKFGHRCVTVLTEARKTAQFILGERDSLSFTMHDLIHADHFYHHNECYQGQLGLYGFLDSCKEDFAELLRNPEFLKEFEYLIADMNAYAIHSLKCLKAAIIHYGSAEVFKAWAEKFEVSAELLALNTPVHVPEVCDAKILTWLDQFRKA